ncbi:PREDICTED: uncharacterized protein LOC106745489 isoform X2 [Dinoponera quadriceps]|nr:PREDICTED: uncharacterized protein LOC106745489 isoform X2 [Dinoponera quadriceps]
MDDVSARREARRRRILENSESRLRKITSRCGPGSGETKDLVDETNIKRATRRQTGLEDLEDCLHTNAVRQNPDENKEDNKPQAKNDGVKSSLEEYTNKNGVCNIENNRHLHHYSIFNENKREELDERFSNDIDDRNTWPLDQVFDEKTYDEKSCTYLSYPINLIILAAIVNILLVLKLDDWFGKAVFIPYLLLMMGRLCNFEKLQETKCSTLISVLSTVILWKVKPSLTCKLKVLFILFSVIINDFCLYTFSFVLMHYFISTCIIITIS